MSVSLKPLTVDEFLAWERAQPARYEFDGIQPVAMTGGSRLHARMIARLTLALGNRLRAPCEVFSSELKVITNGRVRYPGVSVVCSADGDDDTIEPAIVFEVLSPSTALTGRRVKAAEYAAVPGILAHVMPETTAPKSPSVAASRTGRRKPSKASAPTSACRKSASRSRWRTCTAASRRGTALLLVK